MLGPRIVTEKRCHLYPNSWLQPTDLGTMYFLVECRRVAKTTACKAVTIWKQRRCESYLNHHLGSIVHRLGPQTVDLLRRVRLSLDPNFNASFEQKQFATLSRLRSRSITCMRCHDTQLRGKSGCFTRSGSGFRNSQCQPLERHTQQFQIWI